MNIIDNHDVGFSTLAVHAGNGTDSGSKSIRRPIIMGNSFALPYDPTDMNWSSAHDEQNIYTRNGSNNQQYLQQKIAALENGEDCVVLASGVAALSGLFLSLLQSGDHVIFSSVTYIAVYRLLHELLPQKFNITSTIVDTSDIAAVEKAIEPNTKLIHIETPGNPTLSISDISSLAAIAHRYKILLSVDNTLASPYNQRPLELGADFAVESLTKFINGHGDSLGGAIIGAKKYIDLIRAQAQINFGGIISPFAAWLIMRGASTLALRMRQHNKNALQVATYLQTVPGVSFVSYPGLASHPDYAVAKKQMSRGFGGVLSFGLKADHETHNRLVSHLRIITSAVSLGHDESLIVFLGENDERQYLYPEAFHNGFFRLSVGIEDATDIIADLQQAFEKEKLI